MKKKREAKRSVTIKDVANMAGVSIGTASRVINGHANVDPGIQRRVKQAIASLEYEPNVFAQSMRSRTSRTVGIMVPDITVPSLASFVRAAQDTLRLAGYTLLIACTENRRDLEIEMLSLLEARRVDGVIMTLSSEHATDLLAAFNASRLPVVLLDREVADGSADMMMIAHAEGFSQATGYLLELGHRRIGIITGSNDVHPGRDRMRGYEAAYTRLKLSPPPDLMRRNGFSSEAAFIETSNMLGQPNPPTAILAGGINSLGGVLRAIQSRKLRIPEDISVIGGSDSDLSLLSTPPISVVRTDFAELGRTGTRLLLDRIAGDDSAPRRIIFSTDFIIRASCAAPKRNGDAQA